MRKGGKTNKQAKAEEKRKKKWGHNHPAWETCQEASQEKDAVRCPMLPPKIQ